MKVVLIGSNGLLGCAIRKSLQDLDVKTLLLTHKSFDIRNTADYQIMQDFQADVVINTAAYLGVEPCEKNSLDAFDINTRAVRDLAKFCEKNNMLFVQISTDGIFDGLEGNYNEDAHPKPVNMYGLTKYNAERFVEIICSKYYIFRIPILFGERENQGNIFIEKMYNLYLQGNKQLKIADDIINRPSYSNDIAKYIINIVLQQEEYGIYHLFNSGEKASLYDFAREFFSAKGINDVELIQAKASDFSYNEIGVKPLDTTLTTKRDNNLRDWKEAMQEYCKLLKG